MTSKCWWKCTNWPRNSLSLSMTWGGGVRTALQRSAAARGNSTASWTWSVRSENWWVDAFCLQLSSVPEALSGHLSSGITFTSPTTWANQWKWCDVALKWVDNCIEQLHSIRVASCGDTECVGCEAVVRTLPISLKICFQKHILAFDVALICYCLLPAGFHTVFCFKTMHCPTLSTSPISRSVYHNPFSQFSLVM